MALKDWKKVGTDEWQKESKKVIRIVMGKKYHHYNVDLLDSNGKVELLERFETKPQALKFARQYMRTH